jgi:hypothetical protein
MRRCDATYGLLSWFGVPKRRLAEFMLSRERLIVAVVGFGSNLSERRAVSVVEDSVRRCDDHKAVRDVGNRAPRC